MLKVPTSEDCIFQVRPTNAGRLEWYRGYDPSAFDGIYAFSDIISVRHASDNKFQKKTTVMVPVDAKTTEEFEVRSLNIEHGSYEMAEEEQHEFINGSVKMSHTVTGTNR